VVENGVFPCDERFLRDEEYEDVALEITPRSPLPKYEPVNHRRTVSMTYRARREWDLWKTREAKRHQLIGDYFSDRMSNPRYQDFWAGIKQEYFQIQKDWIREKLVEFNPEAIQPRDVLAKAGEAIRQGLGPKAREQWESDPEIQDCLTALKSRWK
jgi:hypothetical protein